MLNFAVYPCRGSWQAAVLMGTRIIVSKDGFKTGQAAYRWLFKTYGPLLALEVSDIKDLARNQILSPIIKSA